MIVHEIKSNSRGVAILFGKDFEYKIHSMEKDNASNMIIVNLKISHIELKLINIYAPNVDNPNFFLKLKNVIQTNTQDYVLVCGDLNLTLNPVKDSFNYVNINNPQSRNMLINLMDEQNLIDAFCYFHPDKKRYSWRQKNSIKQARLDYILISNT